MPILTNVAEVVNESFDYIVVGGGTAGLALAARLSEDPSVTVLVLEAGESHINDPKVDIPAQYGATFMNPDYDWAFQVVKQKNSNDIEPVWARGKGLGGSSALNFICWTKPPAQDIDAFEKLGNPGWNWVDYEKYSKKSETFRPAAKEITDLYPHTFNLKFRGTSGPIQVTVPIHAHALDKIFQETLINKGVKRIDDPYGGDITGTWIAANSVDDKWSRSYSATGYLFPNADRANLTVVTGALVSHVLFADTVTTGGDLVATGVEFIHKDVKNTVSALQEVILSAGAIKSPQILELSGIGQPSVHAKIGVETKIDLPGVGENVQEHTFALVILELDSSTVNHQTLDALADPEFAKESLRLHAEGKGLHRTGITSFAFLPLSSRDPELTSELIDSLEKEISALKDEGKIGPGLARQYDLQLATLKDDTQPDMEFIVFPGSFIPQPATALGKKFVSIITSLNHPISRGTIHAKSNDPLDNPEIDPNYFGNKFDLQVLVEQIKYIRTLTEAEPFKSSVVQEVVPGPNCVSDGDIAEFVKNVHSTTFHTAGSCSMLPRKDLGVVDPQLKVYGTKNLRVADLSIVPLHIATHTQATVYVIGEKAADIIRNANGGRK